jgi:Leucine-rich repeat (LRR) protein
MQKHMLILCVASCFLGTCLFAGEPENPETYLNETNLFCRLPREIIHLITSYLCTSDDLDSLTDDKKVSAKQYRIITFQHTCKFLYHTATIPGKICWIERNPKDYASAPPDTLMQSIVRGLKRIIGRQGNNPIGLDIGSNFPNVHNSFDIEQFFAVCSDPAFSPHIKKIALSNIPVTHIPISIQRMPVLQKLFLQGNRDFKFDEKDILTLTKVLSLKSLKVANNDLESLDPAITQLCDISDQEFYYGTVPEGKPQLAVLESLSLPHNKLKREDLVLLNQMPLRVLNISGNSHITYEDVTETLTRYASPYPHRRIIVDGLTITQELSDLISILGGELEEHVQGMADRYGHGKVKLTFEERPEDY